MREKLRGENLFEVRRGDRVVGEHVEPILVGDLDRKPHAVGHRPGSAKTDLMSPSWGLWVTIAPGPGV